MQSNPSWPKKNLNTILLGILTISVVANQVMLINTKKVIGLDNDGALSSLTLQFQKILKGGTKLTGNLAEDAVKLVFMTGVPEVYGKELNVTYDGVQPSIDLLKQYDPDYGNKKLNLSAEEKQRYIKILLNVSCEFCCGAESIIFKDGSAACGCAHSQAMRGLTAYLLKNHGSEYSDDEISRELAKWKSRYFPKQMVQKMSKQLISGSYTPDIAALLLNVKLPKYDGAASAGSAPLPSEIENAPGMVGGC
jgi:hypothetical protein